MEEEVNSAVKESLISDELEPHKAQKSPTSGSITT